MSNQELDLDALKVEADDLGISYSNQIGAVKLAEKIEEFKAKEKAKAEEPKKDVGKKLTDIQVRNMKATNLKNVTVTNLDPDNAGASTVYSCVENEYFSIARVIPLDVPIALEEALIKDLKRRRTLSYVPVVKDGKNTGTFTHKAVPMYAVTENK